MVAERRVFGIVGGLQVVVVDAKSAVVVVVGIDVAVMVVLEMIDLLPWSLADALHIVAVMEVLEMIDSLLRSLGVELDVVLLGVAVAQLVYYCCSMYHSSPSRPNHRLQHFSRTHWTLKIYPFVLSAVEVEH